MSIFELETIVYQVALHCDVFRLVTLLLSSKTCRKVITECTAELARRDYIFTNDFYFYRDLYCNWYYQTDTADSWKLERMMQTYEREGKPFQSTSSNLQLHMRLLDAYLDFPDDFNRFCKMHKIKQFSLTFWIRWSPFQKVLRMEKLTKLFLPTVVRSGRKELVQHFWSQIRKSDLDTWSDAMKESTLPIYYALSQIPEYRSRKLNSGPRDKSYRWAYLQKINRYKPCIYTKDYELVGFSSGPGVPIRQPSQEEKDRFQQYINTHTGQNEKPTFEDPPDTWILKKLCFTACFRSKRFDLLSRMHVKGATIITFDKFIDLDQDTDLIDYRISTCAADTLTLKTKNLTCYYYSNYSTDKTDYSRLDLHIRLHFFDKHDIKSSNEIIRDYFCFKTTLSNGDFFDELDADYNELFIQLLDSKNYQACICLLMKDKVDRQCILKRLENENSLVYTMYKLLLL